MLNADCAAEEETADWCVCVSNKLIRKEKREGVPGANYQRKEYDHQITTATFAAPTTTTFSPYPSLAQSCCSCNPSSHLRPAVQPRHVEFRRKKVVPGVFSHGQSQYRSAQCRHVPSRAGCNRALQVPAKNSRKNLTKIFVKLKKTCKTILVVVSHTVRPSSPTTLCTFPASWELIQPRVNWCQGKASIRLID